MERMIDIKPLENYSIWVLFSDNRSGIIDIKPYITTGVSEKLLDIDYFKKAKIDDFGGISWDNGFDFCPNYLHELIEDKNNALIA